MPKKKEIDAAKLIKAVESKMPSNEIMKKFDLKTSSQVKAAYLDALITAGRIPEIAGTRKSVKGAKDNSIKVNKRGSLVIPKEIVDALGFSIGDSFTVRNTKTGVSLKKE